MCLVEYGQCNTNTRQSVTGDIIGVKSANHPTDPYIAMYIEFMTEYWYLFAMLLVTVFLLSIQGTGTSATITPAQLPQLQARENAVIVDVNETEKFRTGHISRAVNIPFSVLGDSLNKLKKYQKKTIVLTCDTGNTSKKAMAVLKKNEFSDIYLLAGGLGAWRKENLPLEKG